MNGPRAGVVGLLALLCACAPPVATPMEPEPPTLEVPATSMATPWRLPRVTLRAAAGDDTVLQLFVSANCSGPELLRRPIEAFRAGVELDAVSGTNVFSAAALTRSGLRSRCSAAASVEVRLPMRGQTSAPDIRGISPPIPTSQRSVRLTGFVRAGWTVRVWSKPDCDGVVLASGAESDFLNEPGLEVPLPRDGHLDVSLDATRGFELSRCGTATTRLENDSTPPDFAARLFPQPPHPFTVGAIVVPDLERGAVVRMRPGTSCVATDLRAVGTPFCTGERCSWVLFPLPADATLSLLATDRAGNDSPCVTLVQQAAPRGPVLDTPLWTWIGSRHVVLAGRSDFRATVWTLDNCSGSGSGDGTTMTQAELSLFVFETSGRSTQSARLVDPVSTSLNLPCVSLVE